VPRYSKKDFDRAVKLSAEFRESKPTRGKAIDFKMPKVLMVMGYLHDLGYDMIRSKKSEKYRHTFAPGSRPQLCVEPSTGRLFLIGGRFHVTERGIVDLDARGREIDDS
jgi:hypothetical protein